MPTGQIKINTGVGIPYCNHRPLPAKKAIKTKTKEATSISIPKCGSTP